jgi:hypothetical protein
MLYLLAIPLLPWLLYCAWTGIARPKVRLITGAKVSVWMFGVTVVLGIHAYMYLTTQQDAQRIVDALEAHIAKHGSCPDELSKIRTDAAELRRIRGYANYGCVSGRAIFFYGSTFTPFKQESYDFGKHHWVHIYD